MISPPAMPGVDDRWQMHWIYWPTLLGSALLAALVPWYFGELDVDLRPTLQILLTGGVAAGLFLQWRSKIPSWIATIAPFVAGIVLLDAVWFTLGTFDTSSFLLLFVLPVFSAALVSRGWLVYMIAVLVICVTGVTAFLGHPAFRWYVEQFHAFPDGLRSSVTSLSDTERMGAVMSGHEYIVTLAGYWIAIVAAASFGSVAAGALSRLEKRLELVTRARRETEALTAVLMDEGEGLELIVDSSGSIVSPVSSRNELLGIEPGESLRLVEMLEPEYPERIQQLIHSEAGGEAPATSCRPNGLQRIFDLFAQPLTLEGERVVRIRLRETQNEILAASALEELTLGLLILSSDWEVLFVNESFQAIFPAAALGSGADNALNGLGELPAGWWEIAPRRRAIVRFSVGDLQYSLSLARTSASEQHALTIIHLATGGDS